MTQGVDSEFYSLSQLQEHLGPSPRHGLCVYGVLQALGHFVWSTEI